MALNHTAKYRESFDQDEADKTHQHKYHFTVNCLGDCKKTYTITVFGPDLFAWNQGTHAQSAFPYLSDADRELLFMSGICGECWDKMFDDEEK